MSSDEDRMRRLFREAVPSLLAPEDRVAAIGARVRRRRLTGATAATGAAALGVALVIAMPGVLPGRFGDGTPADPAAPMTVSARTAGCTATPPPPAVDDAALDVVASRLRSTAESRFPESFAGLEITDRVRVFRRPSAGFDEWVAQDFAASCVELVDAPVSGRDIQALHDRIEADRGYWQRRGIDLNTVSVGLDGTLTVGVGPGQTDEARSALADRYKIRVVVQEEGPVPPGNGGPVPPGNGDVSPASTGP